MKKILALLLLAFLPNPSFGASSVTQYGITWTFDGDYTTGQFANGDYYVVDPGAGVVITGISNSFHSGLDLSTVDYDGSDVDCDWATATPTPDQGLDSRHANYNASVNINQNLPYTLIAGKSLMTAISWQSGDSGLPTNALTGRPYLKRTAILTCLATAPAATAFRPSYAVNRKTIYHTTALRTSLLPSLASPGSTNQQTTATYAAWTQGPWTDLNQDYTSEALRPTDNYVSGTGIAASYNQYVTYRYGDAVLATMLDTATVGDKTDLIINLVQIGIDYYGLLLNGARWLGNGGHQMGYKMPILFAGFMLNDSGMLAIGSDYLAGTDTFQDDGNTWAITSDDWYPTRTVCGSYQEGGANNFLAGCSGCVVLYMDRQYDSTNHPEGTAEYGLRHSQAASSCKDDARITGGYRTIYSPSITGHGLAAHILGLKTTWNHDPFFEYLDRWVPWAVSDGRPAFNSAFTEDMWDSYRDSCAGGACLGGAAATIRAAYSAGAPRAGYAAGAPSVGP